MTAADMKFLKKYLKNICRIKNVFYLCNPKRKERGCKGQENRSWNAKVLLKTILSSSRSATA